MGLFGRFSCLIGYTPSIPPVPFGLFCLPVATSVCPYAQRARKPFVSKGFRALVSQWLLFPLFFGNLLWLIYALYCILKDDFDTIFLPVILFIKIFVAENVAKLLAEW